MNWTKIKAWFTAWIGLAVLSLAGCADKAPKIPGPAMERLDAREFPDFGDSLEFKALEAAMGQSLVYFSRVPARRTYTYGKDRYDAAHMIRSIETFMDFLAGGPSARELNRFIRDRFYVYKSAGNADGKVLYTGYYEPTYRGSLDRGDGFPFPLYSLPRDLLTIDLSGFSDKYKGHKTLKARVEGSRVVPYYTREEINGIPDFADRARPVVWLASRVDRFFLEIQGSGRVVLDTGETLRIHYAGTNGNGYRSVGKYLIDENEVSRENMSMQAIRQWLEANPHRMDEVLHRNQSFVFFKEGQGGPFGAIGVAVTPRRSIATDLSLFPRGGLAFVETALPGAIGQPKGTWDKASFFVMNQDTGGAIKGPGRVDLFCGNGDWAEYTAGHMTALGQLYFIVLKP